MISCTQFCHLSEVLLIYIYTRSERDKNNRMNGENEHTFYEPLKSVRRFNGGDMTVSLGRFVVFIHRQGWRIEDQKTERALNKFGLTSEANKHYTRVSLDQSVEITAS